MTAVPLIIGQQAAQQTGRIDYQHCVCIRHVVQVTAREVRVTATVFITGKASVQRQGQ